MEGTVKFFNQEKGYGFIETSGNNGKDIFFHCSKLECEAVDAGDRVEFERVQGKRGPEAHEIRRV